MCPLCQEDKSILFYSWKKISKDYFKCQNCSFIFLNPKHRISSIEEKKQYDLHENDPTDPNYRMFLSQIVDPLKSYIKREQKLKGLDFGCGPGPTLNLMLEDEGVEMDIYDPFYFPQNKVLQQQYDLITCTEVAEHLHNPLTEFKNLKSLLKKNGILAIMTDLFETQEFSSWHYIKDPTHVGFFSQESFSWLAKALDMKVDFFGKRVAIFN